MKTKIRLMLAAEAAVNAVTKLVGLRVLFVPDSSLHQSPLSFRTDGLLTSHHTNFNDDPKFRQVIDRIKCQIDHSTYHEYRIYVALQLARFAQLSGGSIVECGVGEGAFAMAVLYYWDVKEPILLVDTFAGIDPKLLSKEEVDRWGMSAEERSKTVLAGSYKMSSLEQVSSRFTAYPNVAFLKGSCPYVVEENLGRFQNIGMLHIDMNTAMPEAETLKLLYDRVRVPGFILFDDYGFEGLSPQRVAVDAACRELGIDIPMTLPTGQGLIVKAAMRPSI
jgi:hypothetical protein